MEVSLTGPKARPVFGKAKPQNLPVGSGLIVIQYSCRHEYLGVSLTGPKARPVFGKAVVRIGWLGAIFKYLRGMRAVNVP